MVMNEPVISTQMVIFGDHEAATTTVSGGVFVSGGSLHYCDGKVTWVIGMT